jgi:hypothetical protein
VQNWLHPWGAFKSCCISKEIIETDSFDLVSVFEKLIESYPRFFIVGFIQKRVMDGNHNDYLKLRTKSFYYGNSRDTSDGLDEVIWQKRKWRNNSSSLISFK